jgi:hypothetical protein
MEISINNLTVFLDTTEDFKLYTTSDFGFTVSFVEYNKTTILHNIEYVHVKKHVKHDIEFYSEHHCMRYKRQLLNISNLSIVNATKIERT